MSRHHRYHRRHRTTQRQTPAGEIPNPNGEVVSLLRKLVETTENLGINLGTKIDNLGDKMNTLINHVRNIRGELSEAALLKMFIEDLRDEG